ncbi:MAG: cytochrome c oxidase subunit 3 [Saprospiraceae bacterium]|nr:cytochrome c oxidase subunit 3 [Saprospiraceae bacterium]
MMWYFLLSDAFTFAGFLIAYGTLRFSSPTWPVPDFVFSTLPGGFHHKPLIFVTFMTFVLIVSSVTMVRAVQEGQRYNKKGVAFWMLMTIFGGLTFLGCQAWEWTTLMGAEHMSIRVNPFGTHVEAGTYMDADGHDIKVGDTFKPGQSYLIHKHGDEWAPLRYKNEAGDIKEQQFGPKAFGALFFFITGFHGFHVFSGVVFLAIILINVLSGIYANRKNHYEMVEKIGLYWHFVDLVWVFVFLVFYLL